MKTLGSLIVDVAADIAKLKADMGRAASLVEGASNKIKGAARVAGQALAGIGVGLSVAGLTGFVKSAINAADQLGKTAQKAGISVEALSRLEYAAKLSDVSVEQLSTGIGRLSRNMLDSTQGLETAERGFRALGITVTNTDGTLRDTETVFLEVADALGKLPDGATKTALAMSVLGRGGAQMIPLMNGGARAIKELGQEADRFGITISTKVAKEAEQFNDDMTRLSELTQSAARYLARNMLPALNDAAEAAVRAARDFGPFIGALVAVGTFLSTPFRNTAMDDLTDAADELRAKIAGLKAGLKADGPINPFEGGIGVDVVGGAGAKKELAETEAALAAVVRQQLELVKARHADGKALDEKRAAEAEGRKAAEKAASDALSASRVQEGAQRKAEQAAKQAAREAAALVEREREYIVGLEKQLALEADSTELAKARIDIAKGEAAAFSAAGKARIEALAAEIDLMKESEEVRQKLAEQTKRREQEAQDAAEQFAADRKATIESLRTPLERYVDEVKRLRDLGLDHENMQRGIEAAKESLEGAQEAAKETSDVARDLGLTFQSAFEDAIVEGKKFSDVLRAVEDDIIRIVTRTLVTEPFANFLSEGIDKILGGAGGGGGGGGKAGGIGAMFGKLFGFANGGEFTVGGGGGVDSKVVAFRATPGERVTVSQPGRGGGTVINFMVNATDAASFQRSRGQIEAGLRSAVERGMRNS